MDAQRFIAEFGHIANAPGGIARLRELILHLAVSGDLIEASVRVSAMSLLESIEQRKPHHSEQKKVISKQAPVPPGLVKAPSHWAICRLGDLALTIIGGGTPSKNNPAYWGGQIPWASVKDLKDQKYIDSTEDHITESGLLNSSSNLIPPNRILICTRMGLGKVSINRVPLAINQDLKALELPPEVDHDFFLILYKTREVKGTGTTVAGIRQEQLLALPAVLPPIEEQSLIVAKVDELMALCDRLKEQRRSRLQLQAALRQSVLQTVAAATAPDELRIAWSRLTETFSCLFAVPENVEELRQSILTLAVKGKLVPQYPGGEAASAMQRKGDAPFELPPTWQWVRLGQVCELINGDRGKNYPNKNEYVPSGVAWINTGHIEPDGTLSLASMHYITRKKFDSLRGGKVQRGDLVYCLRGATLGKTAIITQFDEGAVASSLVIIRLNEQVNPVFAYRVLTSTLGRAQVSRFDNGSAQPNLSAASVKKYWFPLPPLAEQQRIVERIAELMIVCDELASQLSRSRKLAEQLTTAAVSCLTGVAIEPAEEPVKAPKTELSAPLRMGKAPSVKEQAPLAAILAHTQDGLNAKDLWQRYGGEIEAFYAQLKIEVANGWLREPEPGLMNQIHDDTVSA